ncbi:hypothetical protein [Mycobacterium riyadhense]|uniref:hypothetical protein n=1 Tax=Mycobacterium riyadhense TaxID=486698 RepID=UPI0030B8848D
MVTVEVDPVRVESRWLLGRWVSPVAAVCWVAGVMPVLEGSPGWPIWFGRGERVAGRARDACVVAGECVAAQSLCSGTDLVCMERRTDGWGHRRIAAVIRVPAATVRGWLRRAADRLEAIRNWFLGIAVTQGWTW